MLVDLNTTFLFDKCLIVAFGSLYVGILGLANIAINAPWLVGAKTSALYFFTIASIPVPSILVGLALVLIAGAAIWALHRLNSRW